MTKKTLGEVVIGVAAVVSQIWKMKLQTRKSHHRWRRKSLTTTRCGDKPVVEIAAFYGL